MTKENTLVKEGEKIEDLQVGGLKIIQSQQEYRFTSDAVLLANFVSGAKDKTVVELCSGSGVISILIAYKQQPKKVYSIEIQPNLSDMASRSVQLCNLANVISSVCDDVKNARNIIDAPVDIVVCNPPYIKVGAGESQKTDNLALARHEIAITLEQVVSIASSLLRHGGSFFLVHQSTRLSEIFNLCAKYGMEPKQLCAICSRQDTAPNLVLIKAVKGGKSGLTMLPNIVMFDGEGNYTQTVKALYGERNNVDE